MCIVKTSILVLILLVGFPVPTHAQTAKAPLPIAVQKDFDKGIAAARQQDWGLAVKYFTQASNSLKYPKHPSVLFNLGLAHGKAGHELSAIAWLHAYLAAEPRAPNSREVRKEISGLQVAAEAKVNKILQAALHAIDALDNELDRQKARFKVAEALVEVGDFKRAKEVGTNAYVEPAYAVLYAKHLGMSGDFYLAGEYLRQTKDIEWYHWGKVCWFWVDVRDYASASTCTDQIPVTGAYASERENLIKTIASREKMAQPNSLVAWLLEAEILSKVDFVGDLEVTGTTEKSKNIPVVIAQMARDLNRGLLKIQAREKYYQRP